MTIGGFLVRTPLGGPTGQGEHALPQTAQFPALPPYFASGPSASSDAHLLTALHYARLTKSDAEIQHIRHANEINSRAHQIIMRVLGAGVGSACGDRRQSREAPSAPVRRVAH
ncbi:hypothetical protein BC827DRAFT_1156576 [Russula dissimulans]|nr:hypothetical protein BC827DRAFT_1156576 [Russula dissimulans]